MSTFRDTLSHLHRLVGDEFITYQPIKMEQDVPKRRHIKFRRRGITQFYIPTFRDTLSHLHRLVGDEFITYQPIKMEQSVPKRRNIKFRRRGITQFYMPTFRDTLPHLHRLVGDEFITYQPMKMEQSVPKRRHIKFRRRGNYPILYANVSEHCACSIFIRELLNFRIVGVSKREKVWLENSLGLVTRPSYWLRLFSSQTFSCMDNPTILKFSHSTPTCL